MRVGCAAGPGDRRAYGYRVPGHNGQDSAGGQRWRLSYFWVNIHGIRRGLLCVHRL